MNAQITVRLFATLAGLTPENADAYPVTQGMTVRDLIGQLGVDEKDAKVVFINSRKAELSAVLNSGDRVGIFPPVGGG